MSACRWAQWERESVSGDCAQREPEFWERCRGHGGFDPGEAVESGSVFVKLPPLKEAPANSASQRMSAPQRMRTNCHCAPGPREGAQGSMRKRPQRMRTGPPRERAPGSCAPRRTSCALSPTQSSQQRRRTNSLHADCLPYIIRDMQCVDVVCLQHCLVPAEQGPARALYVRPSRLLVSPSLPPPPHRPPPHERVKHKAVIAVVSPGAYETQGHTRDS